MRLHRTSNPEILLLHWDRTITACVPIQYDLSQDSFIPERSGQRRNEEVSWSSRLGLDLISKPNQKNKWKHKWPKHTRFHSATACCLVPRFFLEPKAGLPSSISSPFSMNYTIIKYFQWFWMLVFYSSDWEFSQFCERWSCRLDRKGFIIIIIIIRDTDDVIWAGNETFAI